MTIVKGWTRGYSTTIDFTRLGRNNQIIAIDPPLIINQEEIKKMIQIIDEAITAFKETLN